MRDFELQGAVLKVRVDLDLDAIEDFSEACDRLLALDAPELCVDLSRVQFVGSAFFGQMFALNQKVVESDRTLVIRAHQKLYSLMDLVGLPKLITIEIVEPVFEDERDIEAAG